MNTDLIREDPLDPRSSVACSPLATKTDWPCTTIEPSWMNTDGARARMQNINRMAGAETIRPRMTPIGD
jgi:hypothetical protein